MTPPRSSRAPPSSPAAPTANGSPARSPNYLVTAASCATASPSRPAPAASRWPLSPTSARMMRDAGVKARFVRGGSTKYLVEMLETGLTDYILDGQTFDLDGVRSIAEDPRHVPHLALHLL